MFQTQLRAVLRASAHGQVRLLLPMLAQIAEIRAIRQQLMVAKRELTQSGIAFGEIEVGAMIEVPAAALMASTFARDFDFISIGTNDLIQYTLAIDRADEQVSHLYDPWHPAVLRLIHQTIAAAKAVGCPVSVCGEMAGDVAFTELLLAMGLRSFSMQPSQIAEVKQIILRSDIRRLGAVLDRVLLSDHPEQTARTVFDAVRTLQGAAA
jgi:phosphotransferase system enzyme I (PtsI)